MSVIKDVMDLVLELEKRQKTRQDLELLTSIRNAINEVKKDNTRLYSENLAIGIDLKKLELQHIEEVKELTLAHSEEISRLNGEISELKTKSNKKVSYSSVMGRG